jgi:hypothetical protein
MAGLAGRLCNSEQVRPTAQEILRLKNRRGHDDASAPQVYSLHARHTGDEDRSAGRAGDLKI